MTSIGLSFFGPETTKGKRPSTSVDLTEHQIRYAMMHSSSNKEAARFINVSYPTYRKYAMMYIDQATGRNLFELHLNQSGRGRSKPVPDAFRKNSEAKKKYTGEGILSNQYPGKLTPMAMMHILVRDGFLHERCELCGLSDKRVYDKRLPLILNFRDGNKRNTSFDNLQVLCYNCYFYNVGEVRRGRPTRVVVMPGHHEMVVSSTLV